MSNELEDKVLRIEELKPHAKFVLLVLAHRNNKDDPYSFPRMETLARDCSMTVRGVQKNLKLLSESGYLKISRRRGRANLYEIQFPDTPKTNHSSDSRRTTVHPKTNHSSDSRRTTVHPKTNHSSRLGEPQFTHKGTERELKGIVKEKLARKSDQESQIEEPSLGLSGHMDDEWAAIKKLMRKERTERNAQFFDTYIDPLICIGMTEETIEFQAPDPGRASYVQNDPSIADWISDAMMEAKKLNGPLEVRCMAQEVAC